MRNSDYIEIPTAVVVLCGIGRTSLVHQYSIDIFASVLQKLRSSFARKFTNESTKHRFHYIKCTDFQVIT